MIDTIPATAPESGVNLVIRPTDPYTQIPNKFFQLLPEFNKADGFVMLFIYRQTLGFHKDSDILSQDQLVKGSGLAWASVKTGLEKAQEMGLIYQVVFGSKGHEKRLILISTDQNAPLIEGHKAGTITTAELLEVTGYSAPKPRPRPFNFLSKVLRGVSNFFGGGSKNCIGGIQNLDPQNKAFKKNIQKKQKQESPAVAAFSDESLGDQGVKPEAFGISPPHSQAGQQPPPSCGSPPQDDGQFREALQLLLANGIGANMAQRLARDFPLDAIRNQVQALPYRKADDPPALLIDAIRENYAMPKELQPADSGQAAAIPPDAGGLKTFIEQLQQSTRLVLASGKQALIKGLSPDKRLAYLVDEQGTEIGAIISQLFESVNLNRCQLLA